VTALRVTSPHAHGPLSTRTLMARVLIATVPGVLTIGWFFGSGVIVNIGLAAIFALAFEALALWLRGRPILPTLSDCSAVVTATLLAIALPPGAPWWLVLIGVGTAILLAKHLYGGLGYNPFNPAMVGYVVLLISFPVEMTRWLAPLGPGTGGAPELWEALRASFGIGYLAVDAATAATPLEVLKQNDSLLLSDLYRSDPAFGVFAGRGWEWVNLAFLAGGLWLLGKRVFTWHAPLAFLATLALLALCFYDEGSSRSGGSPLFHLFSGATMFGAFFILTDPVSSAVSTRGRLVFGALIGVLTYVIRVWGNYPDAVAFAVLLANFAAPFIDHYTQPRAYGHARRAP
jgi:electron transport complex protein RnfD